MAERDIALQNEVWKPVPGYEGLYEVSSCGRIKSLARKKWNHNGWIPIQEQILAPFPNTHGYYIIDLRRDGKRNTQLVSRLVAKAFIPNPDNLPCVDHINADFTDNRVENLRWVTHYGNYHNPISEERHRGHKGWTRTEENKKKIQASQPNLRKIAQYTLDWVFIREWIGIKETARQLGVNQSSLSGCLIGRTKSCAGFRWKYCD